MNKIKWAIVGPGAIAKEFTKDLDYLAGEEHEITAIVGHRKESAHAFRNEFNIKSVYFSVSDLIKSEQLNAVYIASPHPFHHDACLELLEAKIPVLCEKPLAINGKQVKSLIDCAKRNNVFLMEGIWTRFLPSFGKVVDLIKSDTIGQIDSIEASMTYLAPYDAKSRYFDPLLGGGSLLDLGIYPVFLSYVLLGKPSNIQAFANLGPTNVDHSCTAILSYPNGTYSSIESSLTKQSPLEATIFGKKGIIQIQPPWTEKPEQIKVSLYDGSSILYKPEWKGKGLHFEVAEIMKCLEDKKLESDLLPHSASLEIIQILDEIRSQTNIRYPHYE